MAAVGINHLPIKELSSFILHLNSSSCFKKRKLLSAFLT